MAVRAHNDAYLLTIGGAATLNFTATAGGVGIAGAFTLNDLDRNVVAFTGTARLTATVGKILVEAENEDEVVSVTAGASVRPSGTGGLSLIGSANLTLVDNVTRAGFWGTTVVDARRDAVSRANDRTALVSVAGGVNVSSSRVAVGAAADVSVPNKTVTSSIADTANVTSRAGNVEVKAAAEEIVSVAASVQAARSGVGIAGSASSQNVNPTVEAFIGPSATVNATFGTIGIDASDRAPIVAVAGVINLTGQSGVGLSLGNVNLRRNLKAHADSPNLNAGGFLPVTTSSGATGEGIVIGANAVDDFKAIALAGTYSSAQTAVNGSVVVLTAAAPASARAWTSPS